MYENKMKELHEIHQTLESELDRIDIQKKLLQIEKDKFKIEKEELAEKFNLSKLKSSEGFDIRSSIKKILAE